MSRLPKADISKLPLWAQKIIAEQVARIDFLEAELEEQNGHLDNLEWLAEKLSKDLEALADSQQSCLTEIEDRRNVEVHEIKENPCTYDTPCELGPDRCDNWL